MSKYRVGQEVWVKAELDYVGKESVDISVYASDGLCTFIEDIPLESIMPEVLGIPKGKALVEYDLETGKVMSIHMKEWEDEEQ